MERPPPNSPLFPPPLPFLSPPASGEPWARDRLPARLRGSHEQRRRGIAVHGEEPGHDPIDRPPLDHEPSPHEQGGECVLHRHGLESNGGRADMSWHRVFPCTA